MISTFKEEGATAMLRSDGEELEDRLLLQEIHVTPRLAAEWLEEKAPNRNVNRNVVERYAGDMSRGDWYGTGEPIQFRRGDGALINGQHRLEAIVKSGVTIRLVCIWNVEPEAMKAMDSGTSRRLSHALQINGEGSAVELAAAIGWLYRYQNYRAGRLKSIKSGGNPAQAPTRAQAEELLEANPGLREAVTPGRQLNAPFRVPPSLGVFLYFVFSCIDEEDARGFWNGLVSGAGLEEGSPILALRAKLQDWVVKRQDRNKAQPDAVEYAAHIIKAWNLYRKGKPAHKIVWRRGGANPEPFPLAR